MREIKFRQFVWLEGKSGPGKMVDWDGLLADEGEELKYCFTMPFSNASPLMQFTGLHDKNGREIYEGDWLEHYATCGYVVSEDGMFSLNSSARVNFGYRQPLAYINTHETIVIGNIHENPELLKGGDPA